VVGVHDPGHLITRVEDTISPTEYKRRINWW
jgi:hypothetical protein